MTKQSQTESLRNFLSGNGWQTQDNIVWKRGDLKVALTMPKGWVLAKLDINAPRDYTEVGRGTDLAELERHLKG